jgi:hypothetical protein
LRRRPRASQRKDRAVQRLQREVHQSSLKQTLSTSPWFASLSPQGKRPVFPTITRYTLLEPLRDYAIYDIDRRAALPVSATTTRLRSPLQNILVVARCAKNEKFYCFCSKIFSHHETTTTTNQHHRKTPTPTKTLFWRFFWFFLKKQKRGGKNETETAMLNKKEEKRKSRQMVINFVKDETFSSLLAPMGRGAVGCGGWALSLLAHRPPSHHQQRQQLSSSAAQQMLIHRIRFL